MSICDRSNKTEQGKVLESKMDKTRETALASLLGAKPSKWMMHPSERLAILGVVSTLQPMRTLEFGCASGGLTCWLSEYSHEVVTVDIDPGINSVVAGLGNVTPMCMTTLEAARSIRAQGQRFDLTIIDAEHSKQGVQSDLENALGFSDVIVLHDTFYPPCREGIRAALSGRNVYFDLDLVPGGLQTDGLWGGVGIVMPLLEKCDPANITPRLMVYPWLELLWKMDKHIEALRHSPRRVKNGLRRLVRRAVACLLGKG
jgi:hypothetical protein